jgi:hypothetical protein
MHQQQRGSSAPAKHFVTNLAIAISCEGNDTVQNRAKIRIVREVAGERFKQSFRKERSGKKISPVACCRESRWYEARAITMVASEALCGRRDLPLR